MTVSVVIGLGFGDEGKGVVTEYLCSQDPANTIVVRFSGGQQAGHKVCKGSVEHTFAQFGSGTLSGCPTYWSQYCTFDPAAFIKEQMILMEKKQRPIVTIHPDCAVTTPYDVWANRTLERKHGTCGTGVYRTKKRHFDDGLTLTVGEIFYKDADYIVSKLEWIRKYYRMSRCPEEKKFRIAIAMLQSQPDINSEIDVFDGIPHSYRHTVFEGSQGLMLDEHIGYMPHCSPSDITPRNVLNLVDKIDEIYLVSRVYQTRHGNGPMTNTEYPLELINTEKENNQLNEYQGEFRKSVLDLDQLMHAKIEGIDKVVPFSTRTNLVLTCTDQVKPYKVSTGGSVLSFIEIDWFANFIGKALRINGDLYINTSPCSTTVRKLCRNETVQHVSSGETSTSESGRV